MKSKLIGIVLLVLIIGGAVAYKFLFQGKNAITLKGYVGGEKTNFLENEKIKSILESKYGIILDVSKAGSIEMVNTNGNEKLDFLWPSSQVALELYKSNHKKLVKSEIIFNSPIVLYSWDIVADALEKKGIISKKGDIYYITKFKELIQFVLDNKQWKEVGVEPLFGKVSIMTTDPNKSNSGVMFAGLLANTLHGDVVDMKNLPTLLPTITDMYARLGYMPASSHDLFQAYLTKGVGDKPVIVGYENQAVEFSLQHKEIWPKVKKKIRILYPEPTVWSSHPLMILKKEAEPLIAALQDEEIQKIAWEEHGFRSGLVGVQNDPSQLDVDGVPESITRVVPMPNPAVVQTIMTEIGKN